MTGTGTCSACGPARGGESAKFWMAVLADLKNRGVRDVFFVVCDGLKGLPDSVNAAFPLAIVQACILQVIRGTFRYASKRYWEAIAKDLKPIYTAVKRGGGRGGAGVPGGEVGQGLPGHPAAVARQLRAVHPVPGLRR